MGTLTTPEPWLNVRKKLETLAVHFTGVFRTYWNIYDGAFYENSKQPLGVHYFRRQGLSKIFDWVLNTPLSSPPLLDFLK